MILKKIEMSGLNDNREGGIYLPDDVKKLLSDSKYR